MTRFATLLVFLIFAATVTADERSPKSYRQLVQDDKPVAYWSFDDPNSTTIACWSSESELLPGRVVGKLQRDTAGPRRPEYPAFPEDNRAIQFSGQRGFIRVSDPGTESLLDFTNGDAVCLEAWVNPTSLPNGQYAYILGKGRTKRTGFAAENQNYALRLKGIGGACCLSFLFRNAHNKTRDDYHRWTSAVSFPLDGRWHHVAITYVFGKPDSIRGYIDGQAVAGEWDMGGKTSQTPVVDDDELWIGSSLGGNTSSTFQGRLDEVAIYRSAIPPERVKLRYRARIPTPPTLSELLANTSDQHVTVRLYENVPDRAWPGLLPQTVGTTYQDVAFGFVRTPKKYRAGLSSKRSNPYLLQATSKMNLPAGRYRILLRSRNAAKLLFDNQSVIANDFMHRNASGHEAVPQLEVPADGQIVALAAGCQETVSEIQLDAGWHHIELQAMIGGKGLRAEVGELVVALAKGDEPFRVLAPRVEYRAPLDDASWKAFTSAATKRVANVEQQARRSTTDSLYWEQRHAKAKAYIATRDEVVIPTDFADLPGYNEVDALVNARIRAAGVTPTPLTNDYEFLRRVTLDVTGVPPTRVEIADFLADRSPNRRARTIDRMLQTPGWADNWVGYWQDVLAENPGILKPKLNNSGPFRWWIYESLYDNKPVDQWVTELVMMRGDSYTGAPAGFGLATQNDIPMAAKAHVLSQAFLGVNLQCARCHDAPYHPFKQADLLGLAAMLSRNAIKLPATSTVPQVEGARKPLVQVTLQPGSKVPGLWPFPSFASMDTAAELARDPEDPRERLAATLTSPHNDRFAQVVVNRLWARYLGKGIVDPVDDWHLAEPSHPILLDHLARELVRHEYDLKHVARLILNSYAYQRQTANNGDLAAESEKWFAAPVRRRLTAEQIVDSLYAAAGKTMGAEALTLDPEGRRGVETFLNLGFPTRAWQLTSLSNERDRPALALPVAQSIVDVLSTFGWRDSRPNPITVREQTTTVLQPLTIANGTMPHRIVQISDNSAFTALALQDISVDELVDQLFLQVVSRPASSAEREPLATLLRAGFEDRRTDAPPITVRRKTNQVSWSNHLSAEATQIKLALERAARSGDPLTNRLRADWRDRYEDVVWAIINSPETIFLP